MVVITTAVAVGTAIDIAVGAIRCKKKFSAAANSQQSVYKVIVAREWLKADR